MMSDRGDAQERSEALDISRSFLVQAPAGSGKTELLIRRFLSLLARAERPEEVVAITFTRKAAAEMLARILDALNSAYEPISADEHKRSTQELARRVRERDQQHRWDLLNNPSRLRVQTIDALCAEIAASAPVAAGESFATIEEDARPRYLEAAQRAIRDLASPEVETREALRLLLLHVDGEMQELQTLIAEMLAARDQWTRYLPKAADSFALREQLNRALRNTSLRALREVCAAVPSTAIQSLLESARFAARNAPAKNEELALCANLAKLPNAAVETLPQWRALRKLLLKNDGDWRNSVDARNGFPRQCREEKAAMEHLLADIRANTGEAERLQAALYALDRLPPLAFDDAQWKIAEALFRVLPAAVRHLKQVFAEYGVSDFPAVTEAAGRVLTSQAGQNSRNLGIRHLLVDEYQDTSVTQQELLEELVDGWRDGDGRTIFLVGDPMQSIYGFRQAEVGLYLEMQRRQRIGQLTVKALRLERNFRSGAGLVQWVNQSFAQIFPREQDINTGAVCYAPMCEVQCHPANVQVHAFLATGDHAEADEKEAERVVDLISRQKMRDPEAKIAILVSARTHVRAIAPRLSSRGIRFRAVEIERLDEVQVVRDLQALTRALLYDGDRIAWLAILRGPWCGVELADLERLCGSHDDRYACLPELIERNLHQLSEEAKHRISRLKRAMDIAHLRRGRIPLAQLVEGTWIALGGPACISGEALEDAVSYFRALAELERAGEIADWRRVQARLEQLFAAPDPDADGSVQIMTIHKAKGLEFDVVILPQLGRAPREDDERLLLWREFGAEDGHAELLLAPVKARGTEEDPLYHYLQRVQRQRRKQEMKRLLYVATTRARRSLHLLGCVGIDQHGDVAAPHKSSPLAQLWLIVEPEFRKARKEFVPRQPRLFTIAAAAAGPSLRRLPLDWQLPPAPPAIDFANTIPRAEKHTAEISFEWVSDLRRHVGTVVHAFLQRIASEGLSHWSAARAASEQPQIATALRASGLAESFIAEAAAKVSGALNNTLTDERGRWCLDAHQASETELSLSGIVEGKLHSIRIDRTFVCDGARWIVDYKTGVREGSGKESFFENELRRYREQLAVYSALLQKLDVSLPVRAGLYFPASAVWRELPLRQAAAR